MKKKILGLSAGLYFLVSLHSLAQTLPAGALVLSLSGHQTSYNVNVGGRYVRSSYDDCWSEDNCKSYDEALVGSWILKGLIAVELPSSFVNVFNADLVVYANTASYKPSYDYFHFYFGHKVREPEFNPPAYPFFIQIRKEDANYLIYSITQQITSPYDRHFVPSSGFALSGKANLKVVPASVIKIQPSTIELVSTSQDGIKISVRDHLLDTSSSLSLSLVKKKLFGKEIVFQRSFQPGEYSGVLTSNGQTLFITWQSLGIVGELKGTYEVTASVTHPLVHPKGLTEAQVLTPNVLSTLKAKMVSKVSRKIKF
ncbi:MAG: hypothetical protein ACOYL6_19045 [Bacteriovoracaceae bacterium]